MRGGVGQETYQGRPSPQPSPASGRGSRLKTPSKHVVPRQSQDPASHYRPKSTTSVDAIETPVAGLLRGLPGVVDVNVSPAKRKLDHRIIHLKDWHFLPRNLFVADLRERSDQEFSEEEIDELYQQHLLEVELVQAEQMTLLRCLLKHHGLRTVYAEGLTDEDALLFRIKIRLMKKTERRLQEPRRILREMREQLDQLAATTSNDSPEFQELFATRRKLESLLQLHQMDLLRIGAPGRLLMRGELETILPADDLKAWEQSNPLDDDGKLNLDRALNEQRENATVKKLLAAKPCAVVLFGGLHNFSNNVEQLSNGTCEYIRVTTRRYRQFADR